MKIFLNEYIHPDAVALLREHAELVDSLERPEELDAAVVRVTAVPRSLMERAVRLKVVGKHGVGTDTIDVAAARDLGIRVVYTPQANVNSVAELIVAQLLCAARRLAQADAGVRQSKFDRVAPPELCGVELSGKTVGLIGMGHITRCAASILRGGFGCKAVGFDPFVTGEQALEHGIQKVESLRTMLEQSDFVSVSVPLTESTRNLIGARELAWVKSGSILVNTSRGGIVDERALCEALSQGRLFAAASDVFAEEPPGEKNPLTALDNFIATPHIGANTEEALYRAGMTVAQDVLRVLRGEQPEHPVV